MLAANLAAFSRKILPAGRILRLRPFLRRKIQKNAIFTSEKQTRETRGKRDKKANAWQHFGSIWQHENTPDFEVRGLYSKISTT